MTVDDGQKKEISFSSSGEMCAAWLFRPSSRVFTREKGNPCVVMAHGFGGTRECGLEPYARRLRDAGFAVLVFDYRHFGSSQGSPRQLLSISRQLQDWAAAVAFARSLSGIDPGRIALWGSSFSGGHVIETAARDRRVAALCAQCPMMDGITAALLVPWVSGVAYSLRLLKHGFQDAFLTLRGGEPHAIPIVGRPGTIAAIGAPGAFEGYQALAPEDFVNQVAARITLGIFLYRPISIARKVECPALIQICEKDNVVSTGAAKRTARRIGSGAEVKRYPIGHFDVYIGEHFEKSVGDQIDFLARHLTARA